MLCVVYCLRYVWFGSFRCLADCICVVFADAGFLCGLFVMVVVSYASALLVLVFYFVCVV